jgi:hypothetical protein
VTLTAGVLPGTGDAISTSGQLTAHYYWVIAFTDGSSQTVYSNPNLSAGEVYYGPDGTDYPRTVTTVTQNVDYSTAAGDSMGQASGGGGTDAAQAAMALRPTAANNSISTTLADLNLYASNNINQKAFGPLSTITYGDSYKNVQGNTTDIFSGDYYKETHGELTQHLYADTHNFYHQNTDTITLGGTAACFLGSAISFKFDVEMNIVLGLKTDITMLGAIKIVLGMDLAMIWPLAMKLTSTDLKLATIDFKIVNLDAKVIGAESKVTQAELGTATVRSKVRALMSAIASTEAEVKGIKVVI